MKIRDIEAFQVGWTADDKPAQRSAWVLVHAEDGMVNEAELATRCIPIA